MTRSTKNNNVYIIYLISFLDLLAVGLTFPLLYPHLKFLGASANLIGLFGTTYSGLQIFFGPLIGAWCDVRGCKTVFVTTLFISSCCYFLCGCTNSLTIIFILRIILGITKHTQTLCKVLTMDLVEKDEHSSTFARSVSIGTMGFVVGPTIGGHLIVLENGFFYICTLTSLLFLINIGLVLFSIPKSAQIKSNNKISRLTLNTRDEFKRLFIELRDAEWHKYWDVFLLRFLYGLSVSIFFTNQSLFLEETFNITKVFIGYTISFLSAIGALTGFFIKKLDNVNVIRYAQIFFTLSLLSLNFTNNVYVYLMLLVPFAILSIFLRIKTMELILLKAESDRKGSLSGICNSLMSVGRFISPLTIGLSHNIIDDRNVAPLLAFVPSFLASILCLNTIFKRDTIKNKDL